MKIFKKMLATLGIMGGLALATSTANADTITIQQGDTLATIASTYGTTVDKLASLNNITNVDLIYAGETLETGTTNSQSNYVPDNTQAVSKETYQEPVETQSQTVASNVQSGNTVSSTNAVTNSTQSSSSLGSAAEQIAQAESGGDYNARNGQFVGKYQLSSSYLNGDYSPENQDRVFLQYCNQRYGSVENALAFRQSHGWY